MRTKKDITPLNEKGIPHGYFERYHDNGQIWYKGNYVNGEEDGYWEYYHDDGKFVHKGYYLKGKEIGFWLEGNKEYFYAD